MGITSTSTFTAHITAPTVKFHLELSDVSGLDTSKITCGAYLEFIDTSNVALFDASATNGIRRWRDLVLNKYVIGGAIHIVPYNDII